MFTHHDGFAAERGAGHDIRRQCLPYRSHGKIHRAMPGQVNHQTGLIGLREIRQDRVTHPAVRARIVEYTPGELEDGRVFALTPGMSYQVADNAEAHRSSTAIGARLFVVD